MKTEGHAPLSESRAQARLLLSQLQDADSEEAVSEAVARFRRVPSLLEKSCDTIVQEAKLKHALTVVALEQGYCSWKALKQSIEATSAPTRVGSKPDPIGIALLAGWLGADRGVSDMFQNCYRDKEGGANHVL